MSTITFMDLPKNTPKIAWKYIAQIQEQNEELKQKIKTIAECTDSGMIVDEFEEYMEELTVKNNELKKENKKLKKVLRFHEKAESMDYLRQLTLKHLKNVVEDLKEENKKLKEDLKLYGFYY